MIVATRYDGRRSAIGRVGQPNLGEVGGMAAVAGRLDQHVAASCRPALRSHAASRSRRRARAAARARAPHLDRRDLRHPRRRGARARRIGEDVRVDDVAIVDQRQRVGEHRRRPRSGSRRSGPRRSRCRARAPSAARPARPICARVWRRFIRLRIRSSPACSDRWTCGITRGSCVSSANSRSSISIAVERRQPQPRAARARSCRMRSTSVPERRRAGQVGAVAGQVDPGQHDLAVPGVDQRGDALDHRARRHRPARRRGRTGSRRRCSGGRSRSAPRRTRGRGRRSGGGRRHAPRCRPSSPATSFVGCRPRGRPRASPRSRPGRSSPRSRSPPAPRPGRSRRARRIAARVCLHRLVGHRAAVDDHHVAVAEQRADRFAFGDVEAAAERDRPRAAGGASMAGDLGSGDRRSP